MMPTSLRLKEENNPQAPQNKNQQLPSSLKLKQDTFSDQFKNEITSPEESPFESGLGTTLRGVSSAVLGAPGNLMNLSRDIGHGAFDMVSSLLGGQEFNAPKSTIPGTKEIEQGFDKLTGGKYQPTEQQKPIYDITQDITATLLPGSGALKMWQKLAIPVIGQIGKQAIKVGGGGETAQELGKTGAMLALSIGSIGNGRKYAENLLNQSEAMLSPGVMINAKPVENTLSKIKNSTWFRGADPSAAPARAFIESIEKNIQNGQIEGKMAVELRHNANKIKDNLGGYDIVKKADKKRAIRMIDEVKASLIDGLDDYGKKIDPVFGKLNQEANKAYATVAKSEVISNFIQKHAPVIKNGALKALFFGAELASSLFSPAPIGSATGGLGLYKAGQLIYRVMKDPKLAKYYTNVILNAYKGNANAMAKNMNKLDDNI